MGIDDSNKEKVQKPESIKMMAARFGNEVYEGPLHSDASDAFWAAHPEMAGKSEQEVGLEIGYITSTGRFVTREEAVQIAETADQMAESLRGRRSGLLSSYLKEDWDKSSE